MGLIDLRSDTVTKPTEEMRQAMYKAEVGDDVYRDDPTVNRLEELVAREMGKEAALFVASGTMANQVAVMTHTQRGDEIILGEKSHIYINEVGGIAYLAGVQTALVTEIDGVMDAGAVEGKIRSENIHFPETSLICVENTHNKAGGRVIPLEAMKSIHDVGLRHGVPVHLDGARIYNAAAYLGVEAKEIARYCDTVNVCLSKGLCAPVGSVLAGSSEFVERARKYRKMLGGGMRQAGIIAAAGIIAVEKMSKRLSKDHENAFALANGLNSLEGVSVDIDKVQTNLIMVDFAGTGLNGVQVAERLKANRILINGSSESVVRFAVHYYIGEDEIQRTIQMVSRVIKE
ncbi:MAG: low-specificity L-threonine aldolase [Firmicutes bacterium]|nr:low-specificity L-threonine aldolase [Bacillota bacterium]MDD3297648.1 low-specificity L-threonine aldolase [Bacillota bacterium]MDD3851161.1 low-specificity L-threonine aldolase [Bacillota bacterium]MDD4707498.1 low-specificity L-threonine aldolase [Bacillota bacterium]